MSVNHVEFGLQQFHFHLPSEHLDDGVSHAMEMHMVWESAAGDVAVVGVYIDVENSDSATEEVVQDPAEIAAGKAAVASEAEAGATTPARKRSIRAFRRDRAESALKAEPAKKKKRAATTLLETVFSSIDAITKPGTVTTTEPLVMSELVDLINSGEFQRWAIPQTVFAGIGKQANITL